MARCVCAALCFVMLGLFAALPALANSVPSASGSGLLNQVISGQVNLNQLNASQLSSVSQALSGSGNISSTNANSLLGTLMGNSSASANGVGNILAGVASGNMNAQTALGLAGISGVGAIANAAGLGDVFNNPLVKTGLANAFNLGGASAAQQQLSAALKASATQQLAQQALTQAGLPADLAKVIASALGPSLTAALGGQNGIVDAILKALGLGGATKPSTTAQQAQQAVDQLKQQQEQNKNKTDSCQGCGCCNCHSSIIEHHKNIRAHTTNQFELYRSWLVGTWWPENVLPALMLMTSQMTSAALQQVQMFGGLLDAKHQMETQTLFQQMTARSHKDYQPSEGMCEFGTNVRSLAASERRADLGQIAFSQRMLKRQVLSGDVMSRDGVISDKNSRLYHFLATYCDKNDNGKSEGNKGGLTKLCKTNVNPKRQNKDIDFTRTLETPLSLDVDFSGTPQTPSPSSPAGGSQAAAGVSNVSPDAEDIFALSANLFAHNVPGKVARNLMANDKGEVRADAYPYYMDLRSIVAKRSVAENSMAAIAASKSKGSKEVAPFLKKYIQELGIDEAEIHKLIGEEPSYFAQMEVLTKKIYENPNFYMELYDKPANVERQTAVMEALGIMQDRDIYKSLLRSEAVLAVYLETLLLAEQDRVDSDLRAVTQKGGEPNK